MQNKKILVFSPHADDVEISMGGTIAKLSKDNDVVIVTCIIPNEGIDGHKDRYMIENREREQQEAALLLGAKLEVLDIDGYNFAFNRKYVKQFDDLIKRYNPDAVFCCWEHDTHQDHQTLSKIIFSALRKNTCDLYVYESTTLPGGINTQSFKPHIWVDISGEPLEKKIQSLEKYRYYIGDHIESIVARNKFAGGQVGVSHAECFSIVKKINF